MSGSQVVNVQTGMILQLLEGFYMAFCKVNDMNVVSDAGSVRSVVIVTKNTQLFQLADCNL